MTGCNDGLDQVVAGIILAAGGSSRFGKTKQLVEWQDEPIVRRVTRIAISAGLKPVIIIVGADGDAVVDRLKDLDVEFAWNTDWAEGQSTSVKAGLKRLDWETCSGCVFLLADQPFVTITVIRSLIDEHQRSKAPIIAPLIMGQRSNPILFDRVTFTDLMTIQGDQGGRAIISKYPVHYMEWLDQNLLIDIDSPEDLEKLDARKN